MIRDWDTYVCCARDRRIVGALAEALYTAGEHGPPPHEVVSSVERWLGVPHTGLRLVYRGLLTCIELSPVRYGHGPIGMSELGLSARVRYLNALEGAGSPALSVWKAILGMAHFGQASGVGQMDIPRRRLAQIVPFPRQRRSQPAQEVAS